MNYLTEEPVGETRQGPYVIKRFKVVAHPLRLSDYAEEHFGMKVVEVGHIDEAVKLLVE